MVRKTKRLRFQFNASIRDYFQVTDNSYIHLVLCLLRGCSFSPTYSRTPSPTGVDRRELTLRDGSPWCRPGPGGCVCVCRDVSQLAQQRHMGETAITKK